MSSPEGRRPRAGDPEPKPWPDTMRLTRFLAFCGLASRRSAMALVEGGRVQIAGEVVRDPGYRVNLADDDVRLDGDRIKPPREWVYYAFHKPRGVVVTANDELGREGITPFVRHLPERVFPVGRLDQNSEGLLLLTNDGEMANRLLHPRYGIEKVYQVSVTPRPKGHQLAKIAAGVQIGAREMSAPVEVRIRRVRAGGAVLRMTLREGKKREVRRICRAVGLRVNRLRRFEFASIRLGNIPPGKIRPLTDEEVAALREATRMGR